MVCREDGVSDFDKPRAAVGQARLARCVPYAFDGRFLVGSDHRSEVLRLLADDVDGPAGHRLQRDSAYYLSNIDIHPAFLNDGMYSTCEVWIGYEVFVGLSTNRCPDW